MCVCDKHEATVRLVNNNGDKDVFSVDAAIASVLSVLESISSLTREQRMTLKVEMKYGGILGI